MEGMHGTVFLAGLPFCSVPHVEPGTIYCLVGSLPFGSRSAGACLPLAQCL